MLLLQKRISTIFINIDLNNILSYSFDQNEIHPGQLVVDYYQSHMCHLNSTIEDILTHS